MTDHDLAQHSFGYDFYDKTFHCALAITERNDNCRAIIFEAVTKMMCCRQADYIKMNGNFNNFIIVLKAWSDHLTDELKN